MIKVKWFLLTTEMWLKIAKLIDNDFIGSEDTFTCNRITRNDKSYNYLTTNKCDYTSCIRVFSDMENITSIQRISEDTIGYEKVSDFTLQKIKMYIGSLSF